MAREFRMRAAHHHDATANENEREQRPNVGHFRDYFAPLQRWLDQQNQGKPAGW
jgi:hypothetical protein